jgi:hypothetical protein
VDELLAGAALPEETEATCDDCAMRPPRGAAEKDETSFFDPVTKCCTYQPELPNFLVGRVLVDKTAPARRTVEERIDARVGVTPLGLSTPPLFGVLYDAAAPAGGFGHARALRCPHHLDDGRCGIWRHRNAVCATWYCKHVRGAVAARFWREGVEAMLRAVEEALARHCLLELGVSYESVLASLPRKRPPGTKADVPLDRVLPARYAKTWGSWAGRERELYTRSAAIVDALAWKEVLAIAGPTVRLLANATRELHALVTSAEVPDKLRLGDIGIVAASKSAVRVSTYSEYDPIELPAELVPLLHRFDGRKTRAVMAEIEKREGVSLDDELLRQLVDFQILVDAR